MEKTQTKPVFFEKTSFRKKVKKAVIAAAGYGTRFLPQTIAMPKEMLPIVRKPVIQFIVEEAISAGVEDIVIVTGRTKRAVEDHFDRNKELEEVLRTSGKIERLERISHIPNMANFIYLRQKGPMGNATPILNAEPIIAKEPFFYLFGDDFIEAQPSRCQQLLSAFEKFPGQILSALRTKKKEDTFKYAFASGKEVAPGIIRVENIIEKPGPEKTPSDLAIVSGFLFTPKIIEAIKALPEPEVGDELVYVDALRLLIKDGEPVYALEIKNGKYHDCGNVLEYMKTTVEFALKDPEIKEEFLQFLKNLIK